MTIALLLAPARAGTQDVPHFGALDCSELGAYHGEDGRRFVVGAYPSAGIVYLADAGTGDVKFLTRGQRRGEYHFSPRRNATAEVAGRLRFDRGDDGGVERLRIFDRQGTDPIVAARATIRIVPVRFRNGSEATLAAWLLLPPGAGPFAAALMIPQSDRFDLWEIGVHLAADGLAVLVYDQRDADGGESVGKAVAGRNHEVQRVYAADAAAAVEYLRTRPEIAPGRIGVVGWSGGGWMGAIVARDDHDLAFYVNVAGNASPWLEQAEHRLHARLFREGFSDREIAEADAFLRLHHDLARGVGVWEDYVRARSAVSGSEWFRFLTSSFNITYDSLEDARGWGSALESAPPVADYREVRVPTLGLFFEHDHSSPPSTPGHFHRALIDAGNDDYQITLLPDLNHGGWRVERGYRWTSDEIAGRAPEVMTVIRRWIARQLADG